jgi:hypothetical protein
MNAFPSGEGEEPVAALFIPGWSEADSTKCAGVHVVGVLLVSLDISTAFSANMLGEIQVFSGEEVPWRESARGAIVVGKSIKPEG